MNKKKFIKKITKMSLGYIDFYSVNNLDSSILLISLKISGPIKIFKSNSIPVN